MPKIISQRCELVKLVTLIVAVLFFETHRIYGSVRGILPVWYTTSFRWQQAVYIPDL